MRYPGEYEFMYVLSEGSKPIYLALTDAERATIRYEIDEKLEHAIHLEQLEDWDFSHNKIEDWSSAYPAESEIRDRLEYKLRNLGNNGNTLTIKPNGDEREPALLGYDKEFDCGRSCHHTYDLYISGNGAPPVVWILWADSHPQVLFHVRVTLMWIAPPYYHDEEEGDYEVPQSEPTLVEARGKKKAKRLIQGRSTAGPKTSGRPRRKKATAKRRKARS